MTYHGTNSWLLETAEGLVVIDPGPDEAAHLDALAAAGPVARILLTHAHADHAAGAEGLAARTGAPVCAWHAPAASGPAPAVALRDGDTVGPLTALHTPGHAADHLCFALPDGTLFSGDHVMAWSTTVVIPPDGDMAAYMASLRRLQARDDALYLPGHGPPLPAPARLLRALLLHRLVREAAIARALGHAPLSVPALVRQLYAGLPGALSRAAGHTVEAHLRKLASEGLARHVAEGWVSGREA